MRGTSYMPHITLVLCVRCMCANVSQLHLTCRDYLPVAVQVGLWHLVTLLLQAADSWPAAAQHPIGDIECPHTLEVSVSKSACHTSPPAITWYSLPHLNSGHSSVWSPTFIYDHTGIRQCREWQMLYAWFRCDSCGIVSLIVQEFRCWRVLLGFHCPACCLPPFAIEMSTHEASCKSETALLSSVYHWRQSFQALGSERNHFLSNPL